MKIKDLFKKIKQTVKDTTFKEFLASLVRFFKGHSPLKSLLLVITGVLILSLCVLLPDPVLSETFLGTVIGVIFTAVFAYLLKIFSGWIEDVSKVIGDTSTLKEIYPIKKYCKQVKLNNSMHEVMYNDLLMSDKYDFVVEDDPDKQFELPEFVTNSYLELLKAHDSSYIRNEDTIRLDDVVIEGNKCTFYLSRSTFYNHLVTNRAIDFLFEGTSLREVLEYGPTLNSLKDSPFSNHVGINALVFLNDGTVLIPKRKRNSTISKNKITSSIATRLLFPKRSEESIESMQFVAKESKQVITKEYLFYGNIIDSLTNRLKISEDEVKSLELEVEFLGLGQNIYEGGKPQMYFAVRILNLNREGYCKLQKNLAQTGKIDVDKDIYFVDYKSMKFVKKSEISFDKIDIDKNKKSSLVLEYEKSFACNIWHFEQFNQEAHWIC